ncbi:MAG: hypothetical protein BWK80_45880 [Desulfobacteraceae bacterium IS3]|nr:MAG: hypothetical protein BWK80_45880 [Desulfobacteraceae bacterium IS3]
MRRKEKNCLICSAKPAEISQKSRGCWGTAGGALRSEKTELRICFKLRRFSGGLSDLNLF